MQDVRRLYTGPPHHGSDREPALTVPLHVLRISPGSMHVHMRACVCAVLLPCVNTRRLDAQLDLRLPQLRHLQLSGNITLSFSTSGPPFLHTSQLTSLTLQQILADTELQQLLHSQPRLSHLTCLAPEPANATTASDLADCTSSIKRVQRLRSRVALATDGFALMGPFNQQMLGPGEFPLPHSRAVLDHIFTPAG